MTSLNELISLNNTTDDVKLNDLTSDDLLSVGGDEVKSATVTERIARLVARGTSDEILMQMFALKKDELDSLKETLDFVTATQEAASKEHEVPISIDDQWDHIENSALSKLQDVAQETWDTKELLQIASAANRASRNRNNKNIKQLDVADQGNGNTNIVNIQFSPTFVQQIASMKPENFREKIIEQSSKKKMVDFLPQKDLEDLLTKRNLVENEMSSGDETSLDVIDQLSLDK